MVGKRIIGSRTFYSMMTKKAFKCEKHDEFHQETRLQTLSTAHSILLCPKFQEISPIMSLILSKSGLPYIHEAIIIRYCIGAFVQLQYIYSFLCDSCGRDDDGSHIRA